MDVAVSNEAVLQILKTVIDPNTNIDFVTAKTIKNLHVDDGDISFDVILGYPAKSQIELIRKLIIAALRELPGVKNISVNIRTEIASHAVQRHQPHRAGRRYLPQDQQPRHLPDGGFLSHGQGGKKRLVRWSRRCWSAPSPRFAWSRKAWPSVMIRSVRDTRRSGSRFWSRWPVRWFAASRCARSSGRRPIRKTATACPPICGVGASWGPR